MWAPSSRTRNAHADAQEMMAEQTAAANASTTGVDAIATIVAVRQGKPMSTFSP